MLNKKEIKNLIDKHQLVSGYIDLETQLTPNGFDLTVSDIFIFESAGRLDFSNKEREVPPHKALVPEKKKEEDKYGWWHLSPGGYKVRTNEAVCLPSNLTGLAFSRTSLLRSGAFTQHGAWDAGFRGRGEFILVVQNPNGLNLKQNARIAQLVFLPTEETEEYKGIYKNMF